MSNDELSPTTQRVVTVCAYLLLAGLILAIYVPWSALLG